MDKTNETIDSSTDTTSQDVEIVLDESLDTEAQLNALKEQNKKLFARAKSAETLLKQKPQKTSEDTPKEDRPKYTIDDEVIDLRLAGYSKGDVEFIMKNGGSKVLEDKTSYVTIALNTKREQAKAEQAANQTQESSSLSEVERKYTPEMLKNMSIAEMEKILPFA